MGEIKVNSDGVISITDANSLAVSGFIVSIEYGRYFDIVIREVQLMNPDVRKIDWNVRKDIKYWLNEWQRKGEEDPNKLASRAINMLTTVRDIGIFNVEVHQVTPTGPIKEVSKSNVTVNEIIGLINKYKAKPVGTGGSL